MDNSMSPADVVALTNNEGLGGNNWLAMIFLFALIFGFGGNGWGGNNVANAIGYENLATSNEVQRGFDNQNSMANQRDILAAVNSGTAQSVAATNQTFHDTLGIILRNLKVRHSLQQVYMAYLHMAMYILIEELHQFTRIEAILLT